MPIVQAKCTNCGGSLQVDNAQKAAICPYCNQAYVVEDAINNFVTNIDNLHVENLHVMDDRTAQARMEAGEAFLKIHHFKEAQDAFAEVCKLTPQDYRGWWGCIRARTRELTADLFTERDLQELEELHRSMQVFLPDEERDRIEQQYAAYYTPLRNENTRLRGELGRRIQELESRISANEKEDEGIRNGQHSTKRLSGWWVFFLLLGIVLAVVLDFERKIIGALVGILGVLGILLTIVNNAAAKKESERRRRLQEEKGTAVAEKCKLQRACDAITSTDSFHAADEDNRVVYRAYGHPC